MELAIYILQVKTKLIHFLILIFLLPCFCYTLDVSTYEHNEENAAVGNNHTFSLEFHFENINEPEKTRDLVQKLIYSDMDFSSFAAFLKEQFISDINPEGYPSYKNDDGSEYIFHSDLTQHVTILHQNDSFVIAKRDNWWYMGGAAHGNYWTDYYIIDIEHERILEVADVLTAIPDERLKSYIGQQNNSVSESTYIRENIWPPDSIQFITGHVVLFWNVYSITPYVLGSIEIEIPFNEIEKYFTSKGKEIQSNF